MFKNYFTIAFRAIRKNKIFSGINVFELSIGTSASLAIYLLVNYHMSFDKFEKDGDRIYRVVTEFTFSGETYKNSGVIGPMGNAVRQELTGIEYAAPFYTWDSETKVTVADENKQVPVEFKKQGGIVFADSAYLKMFGYEWLENFPYRTTISWWIFGMGGVIMIVIALCTLSFQTIKAAMANPVKSLRTE